MVMTHSIAATITGKEGRTKAIERGVFSYGDELIHYDVIRKKLSSKKLSSKENTTKKATRKVVIKVHPDQRVVATVPIDASDEAIKKAVLKQARWIWQNLVDFAKQLDPVLPKSYVSGETQFYLGRRYVLKVQIDPEQPSSVKLSRGKFSVSLQRESDDKAAKVKALLDKWYQDKAKAVFHDRLNELLPKTTWVEGVPSFRVMSMKKQWGSCSTKGNLMLNPHLVKANKECIDYVILHELCHISVHNHSEKFWRLLTQVMPNWKDVKAKLDGMAEMYLNE
jgi:predicted metal-dependent hydrolase